MKTSSNQEVQNLYDGTANSYDSMMDSEIELPIYSDTLSRLAERISELDSPLVDVSCGSGHMLQMYHNKYDANRDLVGIDISPEMLKVAKNRVGSFAHLRTGDMSKLTDIHTGSIAAIINFFAIHHIDEAILKTTLIEWKRVLQQKGQLILAAWEGQGSIDYGEHSDIMAVKHDEKTLLAMIAAAGFSINQYKVELIKEMDMNAIYIEASK